MPSSHDKPTHITTLSTDAETYIQIRHPSLSGPITAKASNPGHLSANDARVFGEGQWATGSKMANDLIESLIAQGCATRDEAEWMMDHWDHLSLGWFPVGAMQPLSHG